MRIENSLARTTSCCLMTSRGLKKGIQYISLRFIGLLRFPYSAGHHKNWMGEYFVVPLPKSEETDIWGYLIQKRNFNYKMRFHHVSELHLDIIGFMPRYEDTRPDLRRKYVREYEAYFPSE